MSESEKSRPRTKTELRRGAEWKRPLPSRGVTSDEESLLIGEDGAASVPATGAPPTPAQAG